MKLMFNKTTYKARWFEDSGVDENYTEKVPPDMGYIFDNELGEWVRKPEPASEPDTETECKEPELETEYEGKPDTDAQNPVI
ncbi:MAG: hypothetical protein LBU85_08945 [Treponema sp.]|jgi:hypothetical protein|nr:hypothetical protein [Treponema sp.]